MRVDNIFSLAGSIVILAIITTLVLPNRQTPAVIGAASQGFIGSLRAGMGN
ncbi:MAG: hypothetical protein ACYCZF_13825 [Anaerolineae bacterium]